MASILFIIMIADIEVVRDSIIRLFADNTKICVKVKTEDMDRLQQYREKVYKLVEENHMEFSENIFEKISHGHSKENKSNQRRQKKYLGVLIR